MKLTKNAMARVVIQALYNLPKLPAADDFKVVRFSKKASATVEASYRTAVVILSKTGA